VDWDRPLVRAGRGTCLLPRLNHVACTAGTGRSDEHKLAVPTSCFPHHIISFFALPADTSPSLSAACCGASPQRQQQHSILYYHPAFCTLHTRTHHHTCPQPVTYRCAWHATAFIRERASFFTVNSLRAIYDLLSHLCNGIRASHSSSAGNYPQPRCVCCVAIFFGRRCTSWRLFYPPAPRALLLPPYPPHHPNLGFAC